MKTYDVVVVTERGDVKAVTSADDSIPTGLVLQAVMSHQQLVPHFSQLDANHAGTILITDRRRLELPPGLTVLFANGVNINGQLKPSPVYNVPPQFDGVQLTSSTSALVTYRVDPPDEPIANIQLEDEYDEWSEDTEV